MGRNLFRRKALIFFVLSLFCLNNISLASQELWPSTQLKLKWHSNEDYLSTPKNIKADKFYSLAFPLHPTVEAEIKRLLSPACKPYLAIAFEKAELYRSFVVKLLNEAGLPEDLFWVALVESEFQNQAVSPAGAAGMWQLMDLTAKSFGLKNNEILDERKDFFKATETAIKILKWNYEYFDDWLLALAAYNAGCGTVNRAIKKAGSKDFFFLQNKGFLPAETQAFVKKILAIITLASKRRCFELPVFWKESIVWEKIKIEKTIDLKILAEIAGIPYSLLREANAELKSRLTPPPGLEYYLKVPSVYLDAVKQALSLAPEKLLENAFYQVRSGDTFYALARYWGISLKLLEAYNPHLNPNNLQIGSRILVPLSEKNLPPPRFLAFSGKHFTADYTVKKGDTLYSIAKEYKITVEELAYQNGLTLESLLKIGTILKVPY